MLLLKYLLTLFFSFYIFFASGLVKSFYLAYLALTNLFASLSLDLNPFLIVPSEIYIYIKFFKN